MLIHTGERPYVCSICNASFNVASNLRRHERKKHGLDSAGSETYETNAKGRFGCDNCSKDFSSMAMLRQHVLIHTGEKPFACNYCPKAFNVKSNWRRHERTHERRGEIPDENVFADLEDGDESASHIKSEAD